MLPDPGDFLQCERGEDYADTSFGSKGWLISFSFDIDRGRAAVEEYLALLMSEPYRLELVESTVDDYISSSAMATMSYYFNYTGNAGGLGRIVDRKKKSSHVQVGVNHYYQEGRIGLTLYFGDGLSVEDPGVRATEPPIDFNGGDFSGVQPSDGVFIPDFARLDCTICGGTGDCRTCGGDGFLWSSASRKEDRNCYSCRGHDGKCTYCRGTGKR